MVGAIVAARLGSTLVGTGVGATPASSTATPTVSRVAGADRVATAVAISKHQFATPFAAGTGSVYLARKDVLVDAMAAGSLTDGPILLVAPCGAIPTAVRDEIRRLGPARVVGLGSTGAVCDQVLTDAADGRPTSRLAGADRYATALAIARERAARGPVDEIYVADSADWSPDAIAAGQLTRGPVLITAARREASPEERAFVEATRPKRVLQVGGGVTTLGTFSEGFTSGWLAGPDRYATASSVAMRQFPGDADTVYLARGDEFADAVAGGVLTDGPVVLVGRCSLPQAAAERIAAARPARIIALGSSGAICDDVLTAALSARTTSGGRVTVDPVESSGWATADTTVDAAVSDDGRYVLATRCACEWYGGVLNVGELTLLDRQTGAREVVSILPDGSPTSTLKEGVSISGDGRYVAFVAQSQVYLRDRSARTTTLVSHTESGGGGNGRSGAPSVAADGSVAFGSSSTDLVPGDANTASDVFLWRPGTGRLTLVSKPREGLSNGGSGGPDLTPDGRFVVYRTDATNLVPGQTSSGSRLVVADLTDGSLDVVDSLPDGSPGTGVGPSISDDGNLVAFHSTSSSMDRVYVRDRANRTTRLVSAVGGQPVRGYAPHLSGDGRHVVFTSTVGDVPNHREIGYLTEVSTGRTVLLTNRPWGGVDPSAGRPTSVSSDGAVVTMTSRTGSMTPNVSPDGRERLYLWERLSPH